MVWAVTAAWAVNLVWEMGSKEVNIFRIADLDIRIVFAESPINNRCLLPSLEPFRTENVSDGLFFNLTVDDSIQPRRDREKIRNFDTGNGDNIVYRLDDGGYQYIIRDIDGGDCCLLETNKDFSDCHCALNGDKWMRQFGLNNALMLIFAFAGSLIDVLLIHASTIINGGRGYAFTAKSGTGKSTHAGLWMKYIEGTELMNDDNPIIRIIDGKSYIYGSPWSGKTPCYRSIKAPLGAITRIDRAKDNSIERLGPIEAFASLLPSCSSMKWDGDIYNAICDNVTKVVETTPVYVLHCLPDKEAALICQEAISK